jgi:hypothetical protein
LRFGAAWLSALAAAVFEFLPVLLLLSTLLAAFAAFGLVCLCFAIPHHLLDDVT